MNMKSALLAACVLLLSSVSMRADTVTVNLGQSSQSYTLIGNGGSGGFGTYLAQQGTCAAGAINTTCTLSGLYTGTTSGYSSGSYSLVTTYLNGDGGLHATSTTPVASPGGGNFFSFDAFSSDVTISLLLNDISGLKDVPIVVNGQILANDMLIAAVASVCNNLPPGVPCTQGNVGLHTGDSISSPITGTVMFDSTLRSLPVGTTPEPEWLAFGGLIPGAIALLRRRTRKA